jgi:hypothetical protein
MLECSLRAACNGNPTALEPVGVGDPSGSRVDFEAAAQARIRRRHDDEVAVLAEFVGWVPLHELAVALEKVAVSEKWNYWSSDRCLHLVRGERGQMAAMGRTEDGWTAPIRPLVDGLPSGQPGLHGLVSPVEST